MDIQIIIATHKEYPMPDDPLYLPVHAGAACHDYALPYPGDDSGGNISRMNPCFCELTALYWAWKNVDAEYIGLCHYRRYFRGKHGPLRLDEARELVRDAPILLPKQRHYWIESNYSQYVHAHHAQDLDVTREILAGQGDAAILAAYDALMRRTHGHRFNMLLMRRDVLDAYCSWLFPILFELEARLDMRDYDAYSRRVCGFVAERLLDVWLEARGEKYRELPCYFTEKTNWPKKIAKFLMRKIRPTY